MILEFPKQIKKSIVNGLANKSCRLDMLFLKIKRQVLKNQVEIPLAFLNSNTPYHVTVTFLGVRVSIPWASPLLLIGTPTPTWLRVYLLSIISLTLAVGCIGIVNLFIVLLYDVSLLLIIACRWCFNKRLARRKRWKPHILCCYYRCKFMEWGLWSEYHCHFQVLHFWSDFLHIMSVSIYKW